MHRCLELARLGAGHVAPNPMVGAVLVFGDRIIGEGYHRRYGGPHAEPECIDSVSEADQALIGRSTLYVSLEPCAHHGKTPPCADLITRMGIPRVVIGCRDPFPQVNGKGIDRLRAAGIEVEAGVLENACIRLNRRFFTFHLRHRPHIVLKWAQTADGFIAGTGTGPGPEAGARLQISGEIANRLVHKWRSEEAAILVGPRTALLDDPALTVRWWTGPDPVRLVIDKELQLPLSLQLFDRKVRTMVFNYRRHGGGEGHEGGERKEGGEGQEGEEGQEGRERHGGGERNGGGEGQEGGERHEGGEGHEGGERHGGGERHEGGGGVEYYQLSPDTSLIHQLVVALHHLKIQSVLVEGGARLLQSFIDEDYWDEARVITNERITSPGGLPAPRLQNAHPAGRESLLPDTIRYYEHD